MPKKRRGFFVFFAMMACALALLASSPAENIRFTNISRNEGLSKDAVMCILQDRSGFMWFGTELGLNRYDGNDFKVFLQVPGDPTSLSHGYILSLHEDRAGILWIGTFNGGLNRYDPATGEFRSFRHAPGPDRLAEQRHRRGYHEDRAGALWIGTDNGLNRLDRATGKFTRYPLAADRPGSSDHIHDICEDREGMLWIATYRRRHLPPRPRDREIRPLPQRSGRCGQPEQ